MAVQLDFEELSGCPGYLDWLIGKITGAGTEWESDADEVILIGEASNGNGGFSGGKSKSSEGICAGNKRVEDKYVGGKRVEDKYVEDKYVEDKYVEDKYVEDKYVGGICANIAALGRICRAMYDTDFIWDEYEMKEDGIRATDAMELRRRYADEVGENLCKSEHDIDRIWKSVHGKCSVLELIVSLCFRLDEMVNEDEPGTMVGLFFGILCRNLGFILLDRDGSKTDPKAIIERFLKREYKADGSKGGLFPLKEWSENGQKDQRKVPIWYQMNAWLNENLDEEEHFVGC